MARLNFPVRPGRWIWFLLIPGCLLLVLRVSYRDEVVGRDRPIVLDDFAFAVQDVRFAVEPAGAEQPGPERSMVVSLRIMNRARRVSFAFDPSWAVLVDGQGVERRISPVMQGRYDLRDPMRSAHRAPIKAGDSAEVDLVFEAPPQIAGCQFRLSSGGPIGALLDGFLSGPRRIALDR